MTDRSEREFRVPLDFLPEGRFQAEIVTDDESAKNGFSTRKQPVQARDSVQLKLTSAGGGLLRIIEQ